LKSIIKKRRVFHIMEGELKRNFPTASGGSSLGEGALCPEGAQGKRGQQSYTQTRQKGGGKREGNL